LRTWIFRGLIVIATALLVISFLGPWWIVNVTGEMTMEAPVVVYPYGLQLDLGGYAGYIRGAEMPVWFTPIMWVYLGLVVLFLIFSLFAKESNLKIWKIRTTLPKFIICLVGISYVVVAIAAVTVISIRASDFFDMKLLGRVMISDHPIVYAVGTLQPYYWLACATGPLIIILSLLRNKIMGKS
jgi:hypothetical protein